MNRYVVTTANYMVASTVSLAFLLGRGVLGRLGPGAVASFLEEAPEALAGGLILGIELAAMLSIGVILTLLFIGGRP